MKTEQQKIEEMYGSSKPKKDLFTRFYSAFLALSIGYSFAFLVLKACKLYFEDYSWGYFFIPLLAYVLASIGYIVIMLAIHKLTKKEQKQTFRREKLTKRAMSNWALPTQLKSQMIKVLALLGMIILTYFIIGCSKKAQVQPIKKDEAVMFSVNYMPPDITLVMFESMAKFHQYKINLLQKEYAQLISKSLPTIQKLLNQ